MRCLARQPAVRHPVGSERIDLWQTELQRMKTEHIGYGQVKLLALPRQQVLPKRGAKPMLQTYNLVIHEI